MEGARGTVATAGSPALALRSGVVRRIGVKPKTPGERGLPKPEVDRVELRADGLDGDYNLYRQTTRSGDPEMAVLLLPEEVLDELNAEGWPVRPGDLGENFTTAGVPYDDLRPRTTVELGEAVVETSKPCEPCDNLFALPYVGAEKGPLFLRAMLHRRGWFARVVRPGTVRRGSAVRLVARRDAPPVAPTTGAPSAP